MVGLLSPKIRKVAAICGVLGVVCITSGSLIAAINYTGLSGDSYFLVNHFVSELGQYGVSNYACIFNSALVAGGTLITLFMLGLALEFRNWFTIIIGSSGLFTGTAATLVGFFPMNNLQPHIKVAMLFFNMDLLTMSLFSLYVAFSKKKEFPRWFVIPGAFAAICFILFLNIPTPTSSAADPVLAIQTRILENRPAVWPLAIMEWAVIIAVLAWVLSISMSLLLASKD